MRNHSNTSNRLQPSSYDNIPHNPRNRSSRVQERRVPRLHHRQQQHVSEDYLNNEFSNSRGRQHPWYLGNPGVPWVPHQENNILGDNHVSEEEDQNSTIRGQERQVNNYVLSEETITKNLLTRTYFTSAEEDNWKEKGHGYPDEEAEMCVICQDKYEDEETLGRLQCGHEYHAFCIRKWLLQKSICPLCKRTALAEEETQVEKPQFIM